MRTADENNVERCYVVRPCGWDANCRWIEEEAPDGDVYLCSDDDEEEQFDWMRSFTDGRGFTVRGLCKYTNEHKFSHGSYVYAWEVYIESDKLPDSCYYCESFSLEARDDEAERYEIIHIADKCVDWFADIVEYETSGACPHADEPFHDELSYFIEGFLNEVFGDEDKESPTTC